MFLHLVAGVRSGWDQARVKDQAGVGSGGIPVVPPKEGIRVAGGPL